MASNTFGKIFQLTTFGESHGEGIGGVIDGCPAGLSLDFDQIQSALDRRKPGNHELATSRKESDNVKFLSGILDGVTTGHPIGFFIENTNQISSDYNHLKDVFRPGHADESYFKKYEIRDHRGGGRASARTTASVVVAGAIAYQLLKKKSDIEIYSYISQIGDLAIDESKFENTQLQFSDDYFRCPDDLVLMKMKKKLIDLKNVGDTTGGIISCRVKNMIPNLGEPLFYKLQSAISLAMMSINATKGIEFGSGFESVSDLGSQHNDSKETNHAGGIEGGISNGKDLFFRVSFKPISSIQKSQKMNTIDGESIDVKIEGRHDPCPVIRATPIVESWTALVLADLYLMNVNAKI